MPKCQIPIVVSRSQWERLHRWKDGNKEDVDTHRRKEYIQYLNETSKQMTKSWPNSLENINKRNEEVRRARQQAAEQANSVFYHKYVKRKKEEQRKMMHSARDTIFKNKDAPKFLLSAVIESVVQKERKQQLKFIKERQKEGAELTKQYDEDVVAKAKEWNQLQETKKKRRFQINKHHQKEILEQAQEVAERNQKEYEEELKMQQFDNIKAREEIEAIKEFEENYQAAEKIRVWSDMEAARKQDEALKNEQKVRADMDSRLQAVLQNSRARVEAKVVQVEKEERKKKLWMLEEISKRLVSDEAARTAREQASLDNARQDRINTENACAAAKKEKEEKMRRERQEAHLEHLQSEARRLQDFNTLRQWELMNRFKNAEIYEDYKEQKRERDREKIREYRERILKQWREREEREAKERQEMQHFYGELAQKKIQDADNKLLRHAAALIEEARRNGRPEYPIQRAIDRYCLLNRLYPMPDLPNSMKEHFPHYEPRDGTEPRYEETPPADEQSPEQKKKRSPHLVNYSSGKRDGLNDKDIAMVALKKLGIRDSVQNLLNKRKCASKEKNSYTDKTESILPPPPPPITATACQNVKCSCNHRMSNKTK